MKTLLIKPFGYSFFLMLFLVGFSANAQDLEKITEEKPLKISGNLGAYFTYFNASGRPANRVPFSWALRGNPTLSIYGIDIPFSFTLSEQQRDFRQPFNQFGLSPKYKWITVHLGHRNIKWSDYSLAGHNAFGSAIELTPKNFRIGVMYGRFLKPIEGNSDIDGTFQTPSYKRTGTSFKLGYGTKANNVDLILFTARDREFSINPNNAPPQLTPSENAVISIKTHHLFFKKLLVDAEFARSIFTANTLTKQAEVLDGPLDKIFTSLVDEKVGTTVGSALKAGIEFKEKNYTVRLKYKRVSPNFASQGAYFFLTDLEKVTLEPVVKLLKNKLIVGGSFGLQRDNLDKLKNTRTNRIIYSSTINYTPIQQYNLNASYVNYGITQKPGTQPIDNQLEIAQVNAQVTVNQIVNLLNKSKSQRHSILLLWNYQDLSDDNASTAQFSEFKSHILTPRYTFSHLPWKLSASAGYVYTIFKFTDRRTINQGPSATLSKRFKKPNLSVSATFNYYLIESLAFGQTDHSNAFIVALQSKYRLGKKHLFSARIHLNNGNVAGINPLNYSETKIDFGYVYTL